MGMGQRGADEAYRMAGADREVHTSAQAGRQAAEEFWRSEGLQECGGV